MIVMMLIIHLCTHSYVVGHFISCTVSARMSGHDESMISS